MAKPTIDDVIAGMKTAGDLVSASEDLLDAITTIAGVAHRLKVAERKAKNAKTPVGRAMWSAIANRRRARLERKLAAG